MHKPIPRHADASAALLYTALPRCAVYHGARLAIGKVVEIVLAGRIGIRSWVLPC